MKHMTTQAKMKQAAMVSVLWGAMGLMWGWGVATADPAAWSDEPSLWSWLTQVNAFEGRFEQSLHNADGVLLHESQGTMALLRPHYLKWRQEQPEPQHLMADGQFIWHHEPMLKQVTQVVQDERLKETPLGLFWQSEGWLAENYTIANVSLTPECHAHQCHHIQARHKGWATQEVLLGWDKKNKLRSLQSTDEMGQSTHLIFTKTYQNGQLSPEDFVWTMPSGVDHVGP